MEAGNAAQNGCILLALPIAPLFKEIGEQSRNGLVDVRTIRMPCQKDPILGGQRAAGAEDLILFHRQLCQLGGMSRDAIHIVAAAFQRGDLSVQRSQLLQKFFDHSCFPPA